MGPSLGSLGQTKATLTAVSLTSSPPCWLLTSGFSPKCLTHHWIRGAILAYPEQQAGPQGGQGSHNLWVLTPSQKWQQWGLGLVCQDNMVLGLVSLAGDHSLQLPGI